MSRGTAFAKIAAMAQLLDDIGLHNDATVMDELLEAAMTPSIHKEAGLWKNVLSRLSGWARKVLFREYRQIYEEAKEAQGKVTAFVKNLRGTDAKLKKTLARHELLDWRKGMVVLLSATALSEKEVLAPYDEQYAALTARLLKLAPEIKGEKGKEKEEKLKESIISPLIPEEDKKETSLETAIEKALKSTEITSPAGSPDGPIPLTTVKKPVPEAPLPPPAPPPPVATKPMPGWKKERLGTSGKHGWEWEWEISPEGDKLRVPKNQLAAASSGKGKILHSQDGRYRPTGGTSSVKLRRIMGNTYWEEEDDSSDPNMSILVRTDEVIPLPLSLRQEPTRTVEKLKDLGKTSTERMERIMALATELDEGITDEEKLEEAAQALLGQFEAEEMEMEEEEV